MESPAGECLSTVLVVTNFLAIPANRRRPHAVMAAPPSAYFAESHSLPFEEFKARLSHVFQAFLFGVWTVGVAYGSNPSVM